MQPDRSSPSPKTCEYTAPVAARTIEPEKIVVSQGDQHIFRIRGSGRVLDHAVDRCNGARFPWRKTAGGTMCPSYRALPSTNGTARAGEEMRAARSDPRQWAAVSRFGMMPKRWRLWICALVARLARASAEQCRCRTTESGISCPVVECAGRPPIEGPCIWAGATPEQIGLTHAPIWQTSSRTFGPSAR